MKVGTMLGDVLKSVYQKAATERYPFVRYDTPARLRGKLLWERANCTGCSLCAKDCPADALEIITIDRKAKRFVVKYYTDRCTFCAQCVFSCRQGCMNLSDDTWELAALTRDGFTVYFGEETDVQAVMAGQLPGEA